jgi:hypothetical protein
MSLVVERIVILPVIAGIRDTAAVSIMSINTVTNAVSGVDLTSSDPIAITALEAYQMQSSAQVETLTAQLAAKTTAYDAEVEKVAALKAEKATLLSDKSALASDKESLTTQLAAANETIIGLQARIVELTPPEQPASITRYQCTTWLRSANLLQPTQSVSDLIKQIVSNPDSQLAALDRWDLGTAVLRNDPMIETLGQLLGLNTQQLDQAFLVASQIQ